MCVSLGELRILEWKGVFLHVSCTLYLLKLKKCFILDVLYISIIS